MRTGSPGRQFKRFPTKSASSILIGMLGIVSAMCSAPWLFPREAIRDAAMNYHNPVHARSRRII